MSITKKWTLIVAAVLGLVLFAFGMYIIVRDVHLAGVAHHTNAWLGGIAIVLGLSLILPGQIAAALKMIKDNLGEYIPRVSVMVGGRRSTDPPGETIATVTTTDASGEQQRVTVVESERGDDMPRGPAKPLVGRRPRGQR